MMIRNTGSHVFLDRKNMGKHADHDENIVFVVVFILLSQTLASAVSAEVRAV